MKNSAVKKSIYIFGFLAFASTLVFFSLNRLSYAEQKRLEPNQLFYTANHYYEARDYSKAAEEYLKIADAGIESGNLYYNIGNSFFKLGKLGYAILFYEKAQRLIPQDADLKSNLDYAKSFVGGSASQIGRGSQIENILRSPFKDFNINEIAVLALAIYLAVVSIMTAFSLNPLIAKRAGFILPVFMILFLISLAAFTIRYYDEDILRSGVVVRKDVDCKYEPIDKSTTYYKIQEGEEAVILNTRNGWRQIERADGKIAWVDKDAVEEI